MDSKECLHFLTFMTSLYLISVGAGGNGCKSFMGGGVCHDGVCHNNVCHAEVWHSDVCHSNQVTIDL